MQSKDNKTRTIELLAPAKNLACGIAAIDHGADAVYIGAAKFGARQSAGNSVEDIAALCDYAHQFGAKVHVTVNTIIYDDEMDDMLQLVRQLEKAKVDALLIQDMGLLKACKEQLKTNISLHASTQCDSRTAEKVRWLASLGFERVVLARELSVQEIADIHTAVPEVELEAFVHFARLVGALYFFDIGKAHALAFRIDAFARHVIQAEYHVLRRHDNRLAVGRRQYVV